ncbi:hypothetical protein MMARJ_39720 [Mycobacterium marseillense]|uniref:Uncharacterized protein n=1 Tax=Mycobacterium marseillense TaxID=701042 RepID=A0ABM7JH24_9MYCO|nr:hypothetical protein MMARJ_39720 [Mycobacterium marseillense]
MPPATGNRSAVATTLANKQNPASFKIVSAAGGRSDMATTVAAPSHAATLQLQAKISAPARPGRAPRICDCVTGQTGSPVCKITFAPHFLDETARSSQKKRYRTVAQLAPDHLT